MESGKSDSDASRALPYDALADFAAVGSVCSVQFVLSIGPLVPVSVDTLQAFIDWCRSNPQRASYGTPGLGTRQHLLGETLARKAGVSLIHVPYNGAPPAMQDLLAGNIAASISVISTALPHFQSGKVRVLLTSAPNRTGALRNVPTAGEVGFPDLQAVEVFGVLLPKSTLSTTVRALSEAIGQAAATPKVTEALARFAFEPLSLGPIEYDRLIRSEHARWAEVVRSVGFAAAD